MIIVTFLVLPSLVGADVSWDIQVVSDDAASLGYGYCPIKVDSDGNPHIAYSGAPPLGYASWNGSEWDVQKLPTSGFAHDLALDANDIPHIILGSLAYATWNQTQWEFQTITADHTVYSSLALDSSGNPHVAYISGDKLKYATQNGSNWAVQTVTTSNNLPDIRPRFALALDSNDTPHIMYYTENPVSVKLAVWKNSSWNIETVLDSLNLNEFGNMVLDSNDNPHFLVALRRYFGDQTAFLRDVLYISQNSSDWNVQTVATNVTLRDIGFLALGPDDCPNIIYSGGTLIYARWTGTTWENYPIDTFGLTKPALNLAVDSEGNPHISYLKPHPDSHDPDTLNVMYATTKITEVPSALSNPKTLVTTAILLGTILTVMAYKLRKKNYVRGG